MDGGGWFMPYIIDGHNLIAQLHDIALDDPDDETRLIARLRVYCARTGKRVTVYFDRRSPGSSDPPPSGGLHIHFVSAASTADNAIWSHLRRLGREAPNWTIVSSDNELQNAAEQAGARVLSSAAFARLLAGDHAALEAGEKPENSLSEEEIALWEELFSQKRKEDGL
jgi:predicted RNA-binding protein with PIN domain